MTMRRRSPSASRKERLRTCRISPAYSKKKKSQQPLKTYVFAVHKLDDDGDVAGLVDETPRLVMAVSDESAKIKLYAKLAKEGKYDPDNPEIAIVLVPFA